MMLNTEPVIPEARALVDTLARIYADHLASDLLGILVHGSVLKGGYIPGCSDIDFKLFVRATALAADGQLPISLGLVIQRDLARIDIRPFLYVQAYVYAPERPSERMLRETGPVPGSYHMVSGSLPIPEATREQVLAGALRTIESYTRTTWLAEDLLEHGGGRLERSVRWLCTQIWPLMISVLTLQADDPFEIWPMSKLSAMSLLPLHAPMGMSIQRFYQSLVAYYTQTSDVEHALTVIGHGLAFIEAVKLWYAGYTSART